MTHRQWKRLRKWDTKTQNSYGAGVSDGLDAYFQGYPRPEDPDLGFDAPFDISFKVWPGQRLEQWYRNSQRARMRGMVDGWDEGQERQMKADQEDWIESQVAQGLEDIVDFLQDRRDGSWAA